MWHLVRPADEVDEGKSKRGSVKEKERTKAITEIYLTRLLSVKVGRGGRVGGSPGGGAPAPRAEPPPARRARCSSSWTTSSRACWRPGSRCPPPSSTSSTFWTSRRKSMTSRTRTPSTSGRPTGGARPARSAPPQRPRGPSLPVLPPQFAAAVLGEHPQESPLHLRRARPRGGGRLPLGHRANLHGRLYAHGAQAEPRECAGRGWTGVRETARGVHVHSWGGAGGKGEAEPVWPAPSRTPFRGRQRVIFW